MLNSIKLICIISLLSSLSSCGSITLDKKQKIMFRAVDSQSSEIIDNVKCQIKTESGDNDIEIVTPLGAEISRSSDELFITCNKAGYKTGYKNVKASFNKSFDKGVNNNITFIGAPIDIALGTAYCYPQQITILIEKS